MQRASLDFWQKYLETMLFFKHTVKQYKYFIIYSIPAAVSDTPYILHQYTVHAKIKIKFDTAYWTQYNTKHVVK